MSENRRFDIQVFESRVQRLKQQLLEGQFQKFYSSTRSRLKAAQDELEDCLVILQSMSSSESSSCSNANTTLSFSSFSSNSSDDLSDISFESILSENSFSEVEQYAPKFIMSTFRKRLEMCSEVSTGILQVNQVLKMICCWFDARYSFSSSNSKFRYKADRIHEWIDLIIVAAGYALNTNMFVSFRSEFDEWIETLNTDSDRNWILPKSIMKYQKTSAADFTEESLLLERIIKSYLYDEEFYPSLKDSIERIVIKSGRFGTTRLTVDQLITDCRTSWVVTSTFDKTRY